MAKTKPHDKGRKSKKTANGAPQKPKQSPETLLSQATALLQSSQPEDALVLARRALSLLQESSAPAPVTLPALILLGEIHVELGDPQAARESFMAAASLDPDGAIGDGAEVFLWLAQLSEEGGAESVQWFEKGVNVLKKEIAQWSEKSHPASSVDLLDEKKNKLASALCGIAEVYMTDLSWDPNAEARCETAVTEALLVAPNNPESLQTLASIRISQLRMDDARAALSRSLALWKDLDPDDKSVPDFSTRISLSRLLMEAEMEEDAIEVLERLVGDDDASVEAWYLGGWCLHLLSEKQDATEQTKTRLALKHASRDWLQNCLKLYVALEYEDERLKEHAEELVSNLDDTLGPPTGDGDEKWEDTDEESSDEEMEDT